MDPHVVFVCFFAVAFVFVVSGLGDKPRKKQRTYRRRPARKQWKRAPKPLPRPRRR